MFSRPALNLFSLTAVIFSASSFADIQEIPAEEMTESYIENTTVIVPKQQTSQDGSPVNVTISPNEANPELILSGEAADPNNSSIRRPDLTPLSDEHLAKFQEYSILQQGSSLQLPPLDLSQAERDRNLREVLTLNNIPLDSVGVSATGPIDYSQLSFPSQLNTSGDLSGSATGHSFIITIPTQQDAPNGIQNLTPGGEYQLQINNGQLQFIINNPNAPR